MDTANDLHQRDKHLFNGPTDARQTSEPQLPADSGLFRKRYRALDANEKALHDAIKDKADDLASLIACVGSLPVAERFGIKPNILFASVRAPLGERDASVTLALRHLEDAVYRAVKALTA